MGTTKRLGNTHVAVAEPPTEAADEATTADEMATLATLRAREKRLLRLARIVASCDIVQAGRDPSLFHKAVSVRWIRAQACALLTHGPQKDRAQGAEGAADSQ